MRSRRSGHHTLAFLLLSLCIAMFGACAHDESRNAWNPRQELTPEKVAAMLRESPTEYVAGVQEVVDDSRCYGSQDGSHCPLTVRMVEFIAGEPGRSPDRCQGWTYDTMEMRMEMALPNRRLGRRRLVVAHPTNIPNLYGNRLFILDPTEEDVQKLRDILRNLRGSA